MRCAGPISFQKFWNFGKTFSWYRHSISQVVLITNPQFENDSPGYWTWTVWIMLPLGCISVEALCCITLDLYYCMTVLYYCMTAVLLYDCLTVWLYYCITALFCNCVGKPSTRKNILHHRGAVKSWANKNSSQFRENKLCVWMERVHYLNRTRPL